MAEQSAATWPERLLLRGVIAMSVVACKLSERDQYRRRERMAERALACIMLAIASVLGWLCRRLSAPDRFMSLLVAARKPVFERLSPGHPPLALLSVLWSGDRLTVAHTICVNFHYLYFLSGNEVRFFVTAYWAKFPIDFLWHRIVCLLADPITRADRVTWLGNTPDEVRFAQRHGCASVFVNHNCFLNEARFPLASRQPEATFDAVLNANAGRWKRHELTRDVPRLAYITYSTDEHGNLVWPVKSFEPAYRNREFLDEAQRTEIYGDTCCGLALSACEGANYSTAEFLLSGLPIVSTPSLGGRDVWFTGGNCLICEPTCESVAGAAATWRDRIRRGMVDHQAIRDECLRQMREHRTRFIDAVQRLFDAEGVAASAAEIFQEHLRRDLLLHSLSFQRSDSAHRHPSCQGKGWFQLSGLPFGGRRSATGERSGTAAGTA